MKERPILFSAEMVRAILDGRKTQTRRIMRVQPTSPAVVWDASQAAPSTLPLGLPVWAVWSSDKIDADGECFEHGLKCPYGRVGDRLWVRETFCRKTDEHGRFVYNAAGNLDTSCCWYRADGVEVRKDDGDGGTAFRKDGQVASSWSPSIDMPRWASRITLEITVIRVERLQEISEADAEAEGVDAIPLAPAALSHRTSFAKLWNKLSGKGSWEANPWVWAIDFRRMQPCQP